VNDAVDSFQDLACLYFVAAFVKQAACDWRLAKCCGFIKKGGEVNGEAIQGYHRNSSNYKLPTAIDGPADVQTLAVLIQILIILLLIKIYIFSTKHLKKILSLLFLFGE